MAKVTAPLLSFGGAGQIGKTMVASTWRGVKYVRQYVKPGNPNTVAQQTVRATFAYLREAWKLAPGEVVAPWNAFAKGRPFTGMNKFVGENVRVLNGEADLDFMLFSPGAGGGLPPLNINVATGTTPGTVDVTANAPTAPAGWTEFTLVAAGVPQGDPTAIFAGPFVAGTDDTSTYAVTLDFDAPSLPVVVGVWARWTKPNGDYAYSASQTYTATTDA